MRFLYISYARKDKNLARSVRSELQKRGFPVTDNLFTTGELWRPYAGRDIETTPVVILLVTSLALDDAQVQHDIQTAKHNQRPVIPLLWENVNPDDLDFIHEYSWIDFSDETKAVENWTSLTNLLYSILQIDPNANDYRVTKAMLEIVENISDVRWIRFIHWDGIGHPSYHFDTLQVHHGEDRFAPMSVATLSLSERILTEFSLGKSKYSVVSGQDGTHFLLPVGDGKQWYISFAINGKVSLDETLKYFDERDYLAEIIPLLGNPF